MKNTQNTITAARLARGLIRSACVAALGLAATSCTVSPQGKKEFNWAFTGVSWTSEPAGADVQVRAELRARNGALKGAAVRTATTPYVSATDRVGQGLTVHGQHWEAHYMITVSKNGYKPISLEAKGAELQPHYHWVLEPVTQ
jgi:hypothetical protein